MTHVHGRCIVLLEGLDKCGKSTAAGEIATRLLEFGPVNLIHFGKPEGEDQFREYLDALLAADWFQGSTIIDRLHWSEEAYGSVYRPDTRLLSTGAINALDEVLYRIGGVVVWKTRPSSEVFVAMDAHDHSIKGDQRTHLKDVEALAGVFGTRYDIHRVAALEVPFKQAVPPAFLKLAAARRSDSLARKEN